MKRRDRNFKLCLPIAMAAVATACSGFSDEKVDNNSFKEKLVEKIVLAKDEDYAPTTYLLTYDEKNRIKKIKKNHKTYNYEYEYKYEYNRVTEFKKQAPYDTECYIYDFEAGKLIKVTTGFGQCVYYYEVNASKPTKLEGGNDYYYTWDNSGNLIEIRCSDNRFSSHSYVYSDIKNKSNIDILSIEDYIGPYVPFIDRTVFANFASPYLPKTKTKSNGEFIRFEYNFDKDGYVTEVKVLYLENPKDTHVYRIYYNTDQQIKSKILE